MKQSYTYKITKKVKNYIDENKMIRHGDSVIVGLSGGADSVCLLLLLDKLRETYGIDLHAVHINHGIRGESAKRDEEFSWKICKKHNIPFTVYEIDVKELAKKEGLSVEEAGREARYACFYDYMCELKEQCAENEEINCSVKIAVAHHMDDQAETVIFNMARGSGINGIGGMDPTSIRDGIQIIRPLLCMTRTEILELLKNEGQEFCTDETNLSNDYSRNQIRNVVIPGLTELQPKTSEHIAYLAKEAREANEYINGVVEKLFEEAVKEIEPGVDPSEGDAYFGYRIDLSKIKNEKPIIVRELIIYTLKQLITTYKDITKTHIEDIYGLISKGKGKKIILPYDLVAEKERGYINIHDNKS